MEHTISSLPSPLLKRLNTTPNPQRQEPSNGTSPLSVKITKSSHSFDPSSPLKWRIKRPSNKDNTSISSSENITALSPRTSNNPINSPGSSSSPIQQPQPSQQSSRKSRSISASNNQQQMASPISNYEASRMYFKAGTRSTSGTSGNVGSPLSTPQSATYGNGVHETDYRPLPSPFDQNTSKSPVQNMKSPSSSRKPSVSSFPIKPKRKEDEKRYKRVPSNSSNSQNNQALKSKTSISNFSHYSSNGSSSHSQLYHSLNNRASFNSLHNAVAPTINSRRVYPKLPYPRANLKDRICVICDERLETVLQSSNKIEQIVELRCLCFCHEDCLRQSIYLEKERSALEKSSLNYNKIPLVDKAFPVCYHCGNGIKAVPKQQELVDEFVMEYVTHEPKPALIKSMSSRPSSPVSRSMGSYKKLALNTKIVTSPSNSTNNNNPYININSPSSHSNTLSPASSSPKMSPAVFANNPYIKNTLSQNNKKERRSASTSSVSRDSPVLNDANPITKLKSPVEKPTKVLMSSPKIIPSGTAPPIEPTNKPEPIKEKIISSEPLIDSSNSDKVNNNNNNNNGKFSLPPKQNSNSSRTSPLVGNGKISSSYDFMKNVSPIPNKKHPQFQVQRQAPSPPVSAEGRFQRKLRAAAVAESSPVMGNSNNTFVNNSPNKKIFTSSPTLNDKRRSMHGISFDILNQPAELSSDSQSAQTLKKKRSSIIVSSAINRSPSPLEEISENTIKRHSISRSNSMSSNYSVSTTNTYSASITSEHRSSINEVRGKFISHLRNKLRDKYNETILDEKILQAFGELRLVDKLLIGVNSMENSSFVEKNVFLFERRLLIIDCNYKSFISLRLELGKKIPRVEISSTSIIKLDFSNSNSSFNRSRNIKSVYLSTIDDNDIIQKWVAAFFDPDCNFPATLLSSTLTSVIEHNKVEYSSPIDNNFKTENNDIQESPIKRNLKEIFKHNGSQSTLEMSNRQTMTRSSMALHRFSLRQSQIFGPPKKLLIIINIEKTLPNSQIITLANILKILLVKVKDIRILGLTKNFTTKIFEEEINFEVNINKIIENLNYFYTSTKEINCQDLSKLDGKDNGCLILSVNNELITLPNIPIIKKCFIQVGVAIDGESMTNTTKTSYGVISVPIWDNLMESICQEFHISFDNDSDDSELSDDDDNDDDDESEEEEEDLETAKLDEIAYAKQKKADDEALLYASINGERHYYKNEEEETEENYEENHYSESDDSDMEYDSDDSTKDQLLRIQNEGRLEKDLLIKYNAKNNIEQEEIDSDVYFESENEEESEFSDNSDDSTEEQLAKLNISLVKEKQISQESFVLDEEIDSTVNKRSISPEPVCTPVMASPNEFATEETPKNNTIDNIDNNSKSPTPRWSVLFQGIDKEWESLNDDDNGYLRYSKWKTLSLNSKK